MSSIDTLPYKTFQKLKTKYPVKTVLITEQDATAPLIRTAYKDHREYIKAMFKQQGVEVYRFAHNYTSLNGSNPELGLVFLANDSVINPGIEIHALIGHNARYVEEA